MICFTVKGNKGEGSWCAVKQLVEMLEKDESTQQIIVIDECGTWPTKPLESLPDFMPSKTCRSCVINSREQMVNLLVGKCPCRVVVAHPIFLTLTLVAKSLPLQRAAVSIKSLDLVAT